MERAAFDRLLTATLPLIKQAAQIYSAKYYHVQDWQDIAQSAFLKMLCSADQYDPARGELLPWACVVIINIIKTHTTKSMRFLHMEDLNTFIIDKTLAIADQNPENDTHMSFLLANLNEEARLYVEGYNYPEIAAQCGFRSRVTAMNRIDNCANRLSRILGLTTERGRRTRMYAKAHN